MRLIRTAPPIELGEFGDNELANLKYAILSHRWEEEEVTFQDMMNPTIQTHDKKGYQKIARFCERARADGFEYAWVDTCCINKESSAELSEAINSMFRWYRDSAKCYAYMSDVAGLDDLASSVWFTRGWTLQELIAPRKMVFLNHMWQSIGSRDDLSKEIHRITKISRRLLLRKSKLSDFSIAKRMSWASARQTTRTEDQAYCLMGIFDINMPLLYGEGTKAFIRLQEETMRESNDESLFAWEREDYGRAEAYSLTTPYGLLAHSPRDFLDSGDIFPVSIFGNTIPFTSTNSGIRIQAPIIPINDNISHLILQCSTKKESLIGVKVASRVGAEFRDKEDQNFARYRGRLTRGVPVNLLRGAVLDTVFILKTYNLELEEEFRSFGNDSKLSSGVDRGDTSTASVSSHKSFLYQRPRYSSIDIGLKVQPRGHRKMLVILFDDIKSRPVGEMMESSVATIHDTLRRNPHEQICFYRPWARKTTLKEIIMHGYEFLVKHCMTEDDAIVFFGYSRGAYAAKALLNMVHFMGILLPGNIHLMSEVWRLFELDISSIKSASEQQTAWDMKELSGILSLVNLSKYASVGSLMLLTRTY